ncbi:hypothetical protein DPMN_117252 [Dreissena polymorpha]|uniref:Uncharacterized protein n=1 Tax=Dreissena polymorpha TaxID=45954 RepID=A0A9D4QV11_DREPO|nr:hypothetical protein DPMN_117252 [Dreissena polymorpha]
MLEVVVTSQPEVVVAPSSVQLFDNNSCLISTSKIQTPPCLKSWSKRRRRQTMACISQVTTRIPHVTIAALCASRAASSAVRNTKMEAETTIAVIAETAIAVIAGTVIVGDLIVGTAIVGAVIVGDLIVGTAIVGDVIVRSLKKKDFFL